MKRLKSALLLVMVISICVVVPGVVNAGSDYNNPGYNSGAIIIPGQGVVIYEMQPSGDVILIDPGGILTNDDQDSAYDVNGRYDITVPLLKKQYDDAFDEGAGDFIYGN